MVAPQARGTSQKRRHAGFYVSLFVFGTISILLYQTSKCETAAFYQTTTSNGDADASSTTTTTRSVLRSAPKVIHKEKWFQYNKARFDKEFERGRWSYLDREGTERARHAAIVSSFYNQYGGGAIGPLASRGTGGDDSQKEKLVATPKLILDVGCGLGTLSDYLQGAQRSMYLGVDFSESAIELARKIRSKGGENSGQDGIQPLEKNQFLTGNAETFEPPREGEKYGTIVFNEVLYYTNHKLVLERFSKYLEPDGIIVVSLYYGKMYGENEKEPDWLTKQTLSSDSILAEAKEMFDTVNEVKVSGIVEPVGKKVEVTFHILGFRVKK